ncbi:uncharacterized protein METZ01_LOCUS511384 [marine metagenome]|uniref:Uncharacterized protein n=1 Tax=marine metagenome TaxID=408172 RepID=A0A383EQD7_9ZZZZ
MGEIALIERDVLDANYAFIKLKFDNPVYE